MTTSRPNQNPTSPLDDPELLIQNRIYRLALIWDSIKEYPQLGPRDDVLATIATFPEWARQQAVAKIAGDYFTPEYDNLMERVDAYVSSGDQLSLASG